MFICINEGNVSATSLSINESHHFHEECITRPLKTFSQKTQSDTAIDQKENIATHSPRPNVYYRKVYYDATAHTAALFPVL